MSDVSSGDANSGPGAADSLCPRCRYDQSHLTGTRCPECGLDLSGIDRHVPASSVALWLQAAWWPYWGALHRLCRHPAFAIGASSRLDVGFAPLIPRLPIAAVTCWVALAVAFDVVMFGMATALFGPRPMHHLWWVMAREVSDSVYAIVAWTLVSIAYSAAVGLALRRPFSAKLLVGCAVTVLGLSAGGELARRLGMVVFGFLGATLLPIVDAYLLWITYSIGYAVLAILTWVAFRAHMSGRRLAWCAGIATAVLTVAAVRGLASWTAHVEGPVLRMLEIRP